MKRVIKTDDPISMGTRQQDNKIYFQVYEEQEEEEGEGVAIG